MSEKIDVDIEGSLKCIVIFSDKAHVDYIETLLTNIKSYFKNNDKRFQPILLREEIFSGEDYFKKIDILTDDCVLAIVILDGFRPNVLFEFGMVEAKKKPVIIIQDKNAKISIKKLYNNFQDTGLTQDKFNTLKEPELDVRKHLSDFGGKHIAFINKYAEDSDKEFIQNQIKTEIEKMKSLIISETAKSTKRIIPQDMAEKLSNHALIISEIYYNISKHEVSEIDKVCSAISEIIGETDKSQYAVYQLVADTYVQKSKKISYENRAEIDYCLNSAIKIYEEMTQTPPRNNTKIIYSEIKNNLGIVYKTLATVFEKEDNCKKAIDAFNKALEIRTKDKYPLEYAMTQGNLGNAYGILAEISEKEDNCKKAIDAYNKALEIQTKDKYPLDHAMTQNNLGTAYITLATVFEKEDNCKKAIDAFNKALEIRTKEEHPLNHAMTQNNLGSAYGTLATVFEKEDNCKKAIDAYNNALEIYTKEKDVQKCTWIKNKIDKMKKECGVN